MEMERRWNGDGTEMEPRKMRQAAEELVKLYSSNLDESLWNELIRFCGLVAKTLTGDLTHDVSPEATTY